jgi:hypothetical protein
MKADIRRRLARLEAKLFATKAVVRVPAITKSTSPAEAMRLYRAVLDGAEIEDYDPDAGLMPEEYLPLLEAFPRMRDLVPRAGEGLQQGQ